MILSIPPKLFTDNKVNVFGGPPKSPDHNLIENRWTILKKHVRVRRLKNMINSVRRNWENS